MGGGSGDEVAQPAGATLEVLDVEDSFREPPEESGPAVFEDLPSGTEQVGARGERVAELQQIVLVAAGSVQEQ